VLHRGGDLYNGLIGLW